MNKLLKTVNNRLWRHRVIDIMNKIIGILLISTTIVSLIVVYTVKLKPIEVALYAGGWLLIWVLLIISR